MVLYLPDEVIVHIFRLCRDLYRRDLHPWDRQEATRHLWALSHINRRCRDLVLNSPVLWSLVTVCVDGWGHAKLLRGTVSRLRRQIELSAEHNLDVHIQLDGSSGTHELFHIIYEARDRWSSAHLFIPSTWWPNVLRAHCFPILTTLRARTPLRNIINGPDGEAIILPPPSHGELDGGVFPQLTDLSVWEEVTWFCPRLETIPWPQIHKYHYQGIIWDILDTFSRLSSVHDLSLTCSATQPGFAEAIRTHDLQHVQLLLPNVDTLRLFGLDTTFTSTILQHLTLPSLLCIQLAEMTTELGQSLADLISRSHCKVEIFIAELSLSTDTASFIDALKHLEFLRQLDMCISFAWSIEDKAEIAHALCSQDSLLPHLEALVIRQAAFQGHLLLRLFQNRPKHWKTVHLIQCTVSISLEEMLAGVQQVRKETGLQIIWE